MAKQLNVNLAFNADTSQAKAQIQDLQSQLQKLAMDPTSGGKFKLTDDLQKASVAAAELSAHLNKATNQKTGTLDFTKLNKSIQDSGNTLSKYGAQLRSMGPAGQQAFATLATSVAQSEIPLRRSNKLLTDMATTLKNTARWQLSSSLLHGFMGTLQSAYGYAQDLNKSLTNIRIVSGQSTEQMAAFAEKANRAAKALSTTTTAYTDAALIYYQQGLNEKDVLERTDTTVKMSNVTGEGVEEVSSYMTAIWNNFNASGDQAVEHYADIMTKLGAETAASTDEIAAGLSKFSAVAETIELSFEMASSAVTAIVDQTRESPEVVGTALKTIFSRVEGLKQGETLEDGVDLNKYSEGLRKVGVNIMDQSGQLKDMDTILKEIGNKWETLDKNSQVALAQTVAGVRQYNQFMALFDNWDHVEENLTMAATAHGTLNEQAEIYAESWEGAQKHLKASAQGIYQDLLNDEFFIDMTNGLAEVLDYVDQLIGALGGLDGVLATIGAVVTKLFAKQMAEGLKNAAYNMQMMTKKGEALQKIEKEQFINETVDALHPDAAKKIPGMGDNESKARADSMRGQLTLQQAMMDNSNKMSDLEKEINQTLIERQNILAQQKTEKAKDVDAAQSQANEAKLNLMGSAIENHPTGDRQAAMKGVNDASEATIKAVQSGNQIKEALAQIKQEGTVTEEVFNQLKQAYQQLNDSADGGFESLKITLPEVGESAEECADKLKELGTMTDDVVQTAGRNAFKD